jgi:hypothetical protein
MGLLEGRCEIEFDPDVYSIVKAYIAKHRSRVQVVKQASTPMDAATAAPMDAVHEEWAESCESLPHPT